jgi:chromosome partitioning protein
MLQSRLSASVKIRESHDHSQPMIHLFPKHKLTAQFESLWNELNGIAPEQRPGQSAEASSAAPNLSNG